MLKPSYLQGASAWTGAERVDNPRWTKQFPAKVLKEIDGAIQKTEGVDWQDMTRQTFPLPDAAAYFDDVREGLENGSGMVKMRGPDVGRYNDDQLRRLGYGLGAHLGTPMFQNCCGERMRDIRDEGAGVGAKLYGATVDQSGIEKETARWAKIIQDNRIEVAP